jgi:NAD(P)-dependent dehydrogenase (short-subunit alcohol dehydrogenase family)
MTTVQDAALLAGKRAMVTGAGRGIGRACALALARAGAEVVAVARTRSDLDALAEEIGPLLQPLVADVRDESFYQDVAALDRLDILVNNAGTNRLQLALDVDDETLDLLIGLNIRAAFKTAQSALRVMMRQGDGGCIVNISSQAGHVGSAKRTVYAMTKHAVEGLTKCLAAEFAAHGVRVNAVAPTVVETPMTRPFFDDPSYRDAIKRTIPVGRAAQPEEVATAVLFLCSPGTEMITGISLRVDGGATAI